ncbi:hypothetical protein B1R32_10410 [Abditibacterium utsteinense]|uniref:Uncharacterized protein n=1 Tax=Abditibacterium utsteinense TaxID=1960156 RepID=A0A2S8SUP4_9BACT|nr:hypothetical protein B1R32_10410 [Abditibacterium utsteinense]
MTQIPLQRTKIEAFERLDFLLLSGICVSSIISVYKSRR